jgi:hypothetical protein
MKFLFNRPGDFAAYHDARQAMAAGGFSIGRLQSGSPIGLLLGNFDIQKWGNLSASERAALDGVIVGDARNGPVTAEIYDRHPAAIAAATQALPELPELIKEG